MAGEGGGGGGLIKGLKNIIGHGYNHSPCYVLIAIPNIQPYYLCHTMSLLWRKQVMLLITSVVLSYWHYNVIPDIMTDTWFKRLSQMCQLKTGFYRAMVLIRTIII